MASRRLRLLTALNLGTLVVMAGLMLAGFTNPRRERFDEIDVHRINVVDAEGRPALVIASNGRLPGPMLKGRQYPASIVEGRAQMAGMIFFSQAGDEVGGLVFAGLRRADGRQSQVGHLSFDQWDQNMVMALQHIENGSIRRTGLQFIDRPTGISMSGDLDRAQAILEGTPAQREAARTASRAAQARGELGTQRIFIGSQDQQPLLQFKDRAGKLRAQLRLDADGNARLEFFDSGGRVTATFPETATGAH
ncbi:MAG TPA: hypothetical protein VMG08_12230 [Allosphingosinicella sp.]|nr:hypothetical protein [Allosphingosinicella sp.]